MAGDNLIKIRVLAFKTYYRGSPTYTKITNMVSTTTVFGLCTCKWGIFSLGVVVVEFSMQGYKIRKVFG